MSGMDSLLRIFSDPPPEFVFEVAADGIAMSRTKPPLAALPPPHRRWRWENMHLTEY